ncbi:HEPN-associated N-terminal domain-containing protein [Photobacterium kagoshimensis]|uniref:HEPN-associated N-terminal domain-containing protein n=1 Tax=Photobacterium kagoshimensis TaxID=2910242 RepID=UPI003D0BA8D5
MGHFSELMISRWETPQLSGLDKFICSECVIDSALQKLVNANLCSVSCCYCGEENEDGEVIAAPYDIVMTRIYDSIYKYYADAQDTDMPRVEKEWLEEETNIYEIIGEFDPGWSGELCEDLCESSDPSQYLVSHVDNDWSIEDPLSTLSCGWNSFKKQVLTKTRYLFLAEPEDEFLSGRPDYIPIASMLDALSNVCKSEQLLKVIPAGSTFYRVRVSSNAETTYSTFSDIGVPPVGIASAGRMNPAGISYFYLASDRETAEKEVVDTASYWSIGKFRSTVDIQVIDFVELPSIPSVFEPDKYDSKHHISFVYSFVEDLIAPVQKDGKEHVDYVPTQIVSEYFRYKFRNDSGENILGLRYPSVKNSSGVNLAIFSSENDELENMFELECIERNC